VLQHLPAAFQSIKEHQKKDAHCRELYAKIERRDPNVGNFRLLNGSIVHVAPRTNVKRYLVPQDLRAMILQYFHDSALSAHLGVEKTFRQISKVFFWSRMRPDVLDYVRKCEQCQRAKPAQDTRVGFHSSQVVTRPMERVFIDFVAPIVRSCRGNMAILVFLDGFSKFMALYPVRKITAAAVQS
jgi:hypothetical protein